MLRRVLRIGAQVSGVLLVLLGCMITLDVFVRWTTGRPIIGVFEIAEVSLLVITFLSMGFLHHQRRELRVDLLSGRATGRLANFLSAFDSLVTLVFFGMLLWTGVREWQDAVAYGAVRRGLVEIPSTVPIGALLIGVILTCLALLARLFTDVRGVVRADGSASGEQRTED